MAIRLKDKINLNSQKRRKFFKPLIWALWGLSIVGIIATIFLFVFLSNDDLPGFETLENPQYDLASIVYAADGTVLGKYYIENRENIDFETLSPYVSNALFATEDIRFTKHTGIDFRALGRVFFKSILLGQDTGGGSTITQQLAKLLFNRPNLSGKNKLARAYTLFTVKLKEWITAVRIEKSYTKEEIVAMYLNKFEFINGAHGIQAASQVYFGKDQAELEMSEAAVLVGMLKNPSYFNPIRFPERTKNRRNVVFTQLERYNYISEDEKDSLSSLDLDMSAFKRDNASDGLAPYFRAELTKYLRQILEEENLRKADGSKYNIYTDGLQVHTTIDPVYQELAEASMKKHMKKVQETYWARWKGMDPYRFKADRRQQKLRRNSLTRRIYDSDRYAALHDKYLGENLEMINANYQDINISRYKLPLIIEYDNAVELLKDNLISSEDQKAYSRMMKGKEWKSLQNSYPSFKKKVDSIFNAPIPMKIFAYNEEGEKDSIMSPRDSVEFHLRHLQTGILAVEPGTGYIKAWVGGISHKYFKYDHVTTRRQVGSTIKPFVYSSAIAFQGISPCQEYDDIQYSIAPGDANFDLIDVWTPGNAIESFSGTKYNLYQGLLYSKNSITVRLVKEMGTVQVIRELLDNVGIDIEKKHPNGELIVPNLPSITLGAVDLTVKEMAGAYSTFANNGVYTEPVFISRIEDKNGKVIYRQIGEKREAINPKYNTLMVDMLKNNISAYQTQDIESEVGGKTGTTNDFTDGWFMGITPDIIVGTWVGGDENWVRFFTLDVGQGSVMAKPFFLDFLKNLESSEASDYNAEKQFREIPPSMRKLTDCVRFKRKDDEEAEKAANQKKKSLKNEFDEEFEEDWK